MGTCPAPRRRAIRGLLAYLPAATFLISARSAAITAAPSTPFALALSIQACSSGAVD
jgi:hypothetical protein